MEKNYNVEIKQYETNAKPDKIIKIEIRHSLKNNTNEIIQEACDGIATFNYFEKQEEQKSSQEQKSSKNKKSLILLSIELPLKLDQYKQTLDEISNQFKNKKIDILMFQHIYYFNKETLHIHILFKGQKLNKQDIDEMLQFTFKDKDYKYEQAFLTITDKFKPEPKYTQNLDMNM